MLNELQLAQLFSSLPFSTNLHPRLIQAPNLHQRLTFHHISESSIKCLFRGYYLNCRHKGIAIKWSLIVVHEDYIPAIAKPMHITMESARGINSAMLKNEHA